MRQLSARLTVPGAGGVLASLGGVCARGQLRVPKPSAEADCNQLFFFSHVLRRDWRGRGPSHGELILNEACLPARYANHHLAQLLGKQAGEQVVLQEMRTENNPGLGQ